MERYKVGNSETIANHSSDWLSFFFFFIHFQSHPPKSSFIAQNWKFIEFCSFQLVNSINLYITKKQSNLSNIFFSQAWRHVSNRHDRGYKNYQIKNSRQIWKISKWDALTFTSWKIIENWNFVYSLSFTRFDRLVYLSLIISIIEKLQPK